VIRSGPWEPPPGWGDCRACTADEANRLCPGYHALPAPGGATKEPVQVSVTGRRTELVLIPAFAEASAGKPSGHPAVGDIIEVQQIPLSEGTVAYRYNWAGG
jgi:hypothetical protein